MQTQALQQWMMLMTSCLKKFSHLLLSPVGVETTQQLLKEGVLQEVVLRFMKELMLLVGLPREPFRRPCSIRLQGHDNALGKEQWESYGVNGQLRYGIPCELQ
jgi:hypothetical protein